MSNLEICFQKYEENSDRFGLVWSCMLRYASMELSNLPENSSSSEFSRKSKFGNQQYKAIVLLRQTMTQKMCWYVLKKQKKKTFYYLHTFYLGYTHLKSVKWLELEKDKR